MTPELLLSRLANVRRYGSDRWGAPCPAHADRNPSLTIKQTADRILLYCWAGCSASDVLKACGLKLRDVYNDSRQVKINPAANLRIAVAGSRLQQPVRAGPKKLGPQSGGDAKKNNQLRRIDMSNHSIQVTVDIYGHLIPGSNKQAVDRLDDMPAVASATA